MSSKIPLIDRDISWLSFNARVLQEAKDPQVPLFERVKFLAIYSSNLEEFYRVRVAHHRSLLNASKKTQKRLEENPKDVLKKIQQIVHSQRTDFNQIINNQILPELKKHKIFILRRLDLDVVQKKFVESYFHDNLLPFVQPVLLVKKKIRPFLNNGALYLGIHLKSKGKVNAPSEFALVKIPSDYFPRYVELPPTNGNYNVIMLDDIVRNSIAWLFPGYDVRDTYSFKLTRDAELYIDDEFSGNLVQKIKNSLTKRNVGPAARFVYDGEMPLHFLQFLQETFNINKEDLLKEGRYHSNADFFQFPDFGLQHLKNKKLPPIDYAPLEDAKDIFAAIDKEDHLLHFPSHSYEPVIRFFEAAAEDPDVTHIKIIIYRTARDSRIMQALMDAAEAGKQVTAFVELKARFDEEANIKWGDKLTRAGVHVHYSFPGLKVHAKLALVVRQTEGNAPITHGYFGTGNFHEGTAKIYSDFALFTTDKRLTLEAWRVFSFLEMGQLPKFEFKHLLIGRYNLRSGLVEKINREISHAKQGHKARMILKMNSLEDLEMIALLYEASRAGVQIDLIVRGICSIVPQKKKWSEHIRVISIVDRYLEHARIFYFHNDGEEEIYLSSADFMTRNLSFRVEAAFPLYDEEKKREIKEYLEMQLMDNTKARLLDERLTNNYALGENALPLRSQVEWYFRLKRRSEMRLQNGL